MDATKTMKLTKTVKQRIVSVILARKKPEKIVLFGSRAAGRGSATSDIDLAIFARRWTDKDINMVRNDLEEKIKTPLKFDVLNFYAVAKENLKNNIIKEGEVLYDSGKD